MAKDMWSRNGEPGAAADDFGFDALRHQLLFEFSDATVKVLDLPAFFHQFLGLRLGQLRVIDESGDDYLYPKGFFRSIALPDSIKKAVLAAAWSKGVSSVPDSHGSPYHLKAASE
jgi:hypothetical protein